MKPPWEQFPEFGPHGMGWRMGAGEEYLPAWRKYLRALSPREFADYCKAHPEPMWWEQTYSCLSQYDDENTEYLERLSPEAQKRIFGAEPRATPPAADSVP